MLVPIINSPPSGASPLEQIQEVRWARRAVSCVHFPMSRTRCVIYMCVWASVADAPWRGRLRHGRHAGCIVENHKHTHTHLRYMRRCESALLRLRSENSRALTLAWVFSLCRYLSIYLSIYISIYLYIYLSNYLSVYVSIYLSVCLFLRPSHSTVCLYPQARRPLLASRTT